MYETIPKYSKIIKHFFFFLLNFRSIANILQCDVMLHLMQTVLSRGLDLKAQSFQESHLQKVNEMVFILNKLFISMFFFSSLDSSSYWLRVTRRTVQELSILKFLRACHEV